WGGVQSLVYNAATYSLSGNSLSSRSINEPEEDVALLSFDVDTEDDINLTAYTFTYSGDDAAKAAISNLTLYADSNVNGEIDDTDTTLATIDSITASITVTVDHDLDNESVTLLLGADVDTSVLTDETRVLFSIAGDGLAGTSNANGSDIYAEDDDIISGRSITLSPLTYTIESESTTDLTIEDNTTGHVFFSGSIEAIEDTVIESLEVVISADDSLTLPDIFSNVTMYEDIDEDGVLDDGDSELGTADAVSESMTVRIDTTFEGQTLHVLIAA
ncbi:MAG: hypothetical protein GY766_21570, partial [Herbaspirillum sp.]|uniref:hypothetical protein n=1 Tax=Herbaspirillum sp. TaxID=1890675 RepID=UPI00258B5787